MTNLEQEFTKFSDPQAPQRAARKPQFGRIQSRQDFVALLSSENCSSVIKTDIGQGASALQPARLAVSAIDPSSENVRHCRECGSYTRQASLFDTPFKDNTFDADWAMITLFHAPNALLDEELPEISRALRSGAPLEIGLWSGAAIEQHLTHKDIQLERFFSW